MQTGSESNAVGHDSQSVGLRFTLSVDGRTRPLLPRHCAAAASAVRPPTSTPAAVYSRRVYRIIIQQTVSIVRQVVGRTRSESQTVIQPVAAPSNGADYGLRIIARRPGPMHDTVDVVRCGAGAGAGQLGG